jgi:hypothetical protein
MLWVAAFIVLLFLLASWSRKAKQRAAVRGLREQFPRIARMRLTAAFPGIEPALSEPLLALQFDWILHAMCRRAGVSGFAGLMRWAVVEGEDATATLSAEVARAAVDRLPAPALAIIDKSEGRFLAGVILEHSLTEAGARITPELEKYV